MQLVGADWQLGVELARSSFMTGSDACPAPLLGSFLRVGLLECGHGRKAIFFYFFSMPTSSLDFLIHIFCGLVPAGCAAASVTWGWVVSVCDRLCPMGAEQHLCINCWCGLSAGCARL